MSPALLRPREFLRVMPVRRSARVAGSRAPLTGWMDVGVGEGVTVAGASVMVSMNVASGSRPSVAVTVNGKNTRTSGCACVATVRLQAETVQQSAGGDGRSGRRGPGELVLVGNGCASDERSSGTGDCWRCIGRGVHDDGHRARDRGADGVDDMPWRERSRPSASGSRPQRPPEATVGLLDLFDWQVLISCFEPSNTDFSRVYCLTPSPPIWSNYDSNLFR